MREHGVENISDVKLVILEVDGNISVVSFDKNNQTNFTRHKKKKISVENFRFLIKLFNLKNELRIKRNAARRWSSGFTNFQTGN